MTFETYLAIALLHMGQDALMTYEAKIPYRAAVSLLWSLIWPLTAAIMIVGVIYRQHKPNAVNIRTMEPNRKPRSNEDV